MYKKNLILGVIALAANFSNAQLMLRGYWPYEFEQSFFAQIR